MQGDGVPPTEARDFCDWLASAAAPRLPDTHFAVCALGDRYNVWAHPQHCQHLHMLNTVLLYHFVMVLAFCMLA